MSRDSTYQVELTTTALKTLSHVSETVLDIFELLRLELATEGPEQAEWPSYESFGHPEKQGESVLIYRCDLCRGVEDLTALWWVRGERIDVDVRYWNKNTAIDDYGQIVQADE